MMIGLKRFYSHPMDQAKKIYELSPMMAARAQTFDQNAADQLNKLRKRGKLDPIRDASHRR